MGVAAAWGKWKEMASLLMNCTILPLEKWSRKHEACVRSFKLYDSETWALNERLVRLLRDEIVVVICG